MVQWPNSPLCHAKMSWNSSNKSHNTLACSSRELPNLIFDLISTHLLVGYSYVLPFCITTWKKWDAGFRDCFQIAESSTFLLFEHIISNMKIHNHLHIIFQINFIVILIIPNWAFASMLHHPRPSSFHDCLVLQFDLLPMVESFWDYHLHHLLIPKENHDGDCQNQELGKFMLLFFLHAKVPNSCWAEFVKICLL